MPTTTARRMHLAAFLIAGPVSHHHGLWRHPDHPVPFLDVRHYVRIARTLERGRFDLLFFASWAPDALVLDRAGGVYADPGKVRYVDPRRRLVPVPGPVQHPGRPPGPPGDHPGRRVGPGLAFAARWAEVVFTISPTVDDMRRSAAALRAEVARAGRPAEACRVLAAVMPFVGASRAEAEAHRDAANVLVHPLAGLSTLSAHANVDLSDRDLDAPLTGLEGTGTQSLSRLAARIARDEGLTLAGIARRYGQSVLVPQLCGTGAELADQLEALSHDGGVDGFVISPALLPDSLEAFVEHVVPELQRRGLHRSEYTATTLRGHLQE